MKAVVMSVRCRPQCTHTPHHTLLHHALVMAHLSGLHGAIKMLVAKLAVLQTHLRDVESGALKHMLGMRAQDDGLLLYITHKL